MYLFINFIHSFQLWFGFRCKLNVIIIIIFFLVSNNNGSHIYLHLPAHKYIQMALFLDQWYIGAQYRAIIPDGKEICIKQFFTCHETMTLQTRLFLVSIKFNLIDFYSFVLYWNQNIKQFMKATLDLIGNLRQEIRFLTILCRYGFDKKHCAILPYNIIVSLNHNITELRANQIKNRIAINWIYHFLYPLTRFKVNVDKAMIF